MSERDVDDGIFAVIAEFKGQAPLILETEAKLSSFDAAMDRAREMQKRPDVIRTCVVRCEASPIWSGNDLLILDMKRMQK